jgi:peptidoglycan/LPS O-acetylase OafA/YrhL
MEVLNTFAYGLLTALSFIAGVFFLRYWHQTRDRFFLFLVITFWALAANWASLAGHADDEHAAYFYLPRLAAFLMLLVGIVDKNRRAARDPR